MNVNKLIQHLQDSVATNPNIGDSVVVVARDAEGNAFRPLGSLGDYHYDPGENEIVWDDEEEDYPRADSVMATVLWPDY